MTPGKLSFVAVLTGALLGASPTHAQSPPATGDVAAAARAFQQAVRLLDARRFADAAEGFERSLAIREGAAALYDLGLARRGNHEPAAALRAFLRFLVVARPNNPARPGAVTLVAELRRRVAHLRVDVQGGATSVRLDGHEIAQGDGVFERDVDPGSHTLEAHREGFSPARLETPSNAGETLSLSLDASTHPLVAPTPEPPAPTVTVVRPVDPRVAPSAERRFYHNGWFWLAVGTAAAVAAAVTVGVVLREDPAPDGGSFGHVFQGVSLAP